ncbi:MAG: hypothetical protein HY270_06315 [Deltaproteobacteria bacterium]|nr:hypothetical protein [Deltaproteobacteria bacterium]
MTHRTKIIAAVVTLAFTALGPGPRGALACMVAQQAARDCCKHHPTLRANDCCCRGANAASPLPVASNATQTDHSGKLFVAVLPASALATAATSSEPVRRLYQHGLAPPDTPITRHILLLL